MKIGCIGSGYVGSTTMSVLAYKCLGHDVYVTDILKEKIDSWNSTKLPIYEPGLDRLIKECRNRNLFFTKDIRFVVENCDIIFICVNTPTKNYGIGLNKASNLSYLESCCASIAKYSRSDKILIQKSTAPLGTCNTVKEFLSLGRNHYTIISNPEFLAEGTAIKDLLKPSRVVLGVLGYSKKDIFCRNLIYKVYSLWVNKNLVLKIDSWSSELIKLASNSFLAQKLSSINTVSVICEQVGGSISSVARGIGLDPRIGNSFLKSSAGFGGSCFEKDILNLSYVCSSNKLGLISKYWKSVVSMNNYMKFIFVRKLFQKMSYNLTGKKLFILGLTFKKDTDDIRNSSSLDITKELLNEKPFVRIYDPRAKLEYGDSKLFEVGNLASFNGNDPYLNIGDCDSLIVLTDWSIFKKLNYSLILGKSQRGMLFVDSRNFINTRVIRHLGFKV